MEKDSEIILKKINELLNEEIEEELTAENIGKLLYLVFTLKSQQFYKKKVDNKNKTNTNVIKKEIVIPQVFKCPISKKLMGNPVILASGQTYDRSSLVHWEKSKNKKSPCSRKDLSHEAITPNHSVREVILKWCKSHGVQEPVQHNVENPPATELDKKLIRDTLVSMFNQREPPLQKLAVKQMLRLLRQNTVFQDLIANDPSVFVELLMMISPPPTIHYRLDPQMHEDMITVLFYLSTDERNKKELSKCQKMIPVLIKALNAENKLQMRCNAAAITYQLSLIYENKEIIGKSNVFELLIELLKEKWSPQANQDAMDAILSLCENEENVLLAMKLGVVPVVAKKTVDGTFADELLPMLKFFSAYKEAAVMLVDSADCLLPMLLSVVSENPSDVSVENAVLILHNVFEQYRGLKVHIETEIEQNRGFITQISQNVTPEAKIMANEILQSLK